MGRCRALSAPVGKRHQATGTPRVPGDRWAPRGELTRDRLGFRREPRERSPRHVQGPGVRLVLAAIGGDHSCHLLPLLDFDLIAENPKIFMGFSDITVLNVAIQCETGLVTFNGPNLVTDFAEHPEMLEYTRSAFLRAVCEPRPTGRVAPSPWWTEEYLDWNRKKDLERHERERSRRAGPGLRTVSRRVSWSEDALSPYSISGERVTGRTSRTRSSSSKPRATSLPRRGWTAC